MGTRHITKRINHHQNNEPECECHTEVRDGTARLCINNNGPGSGENHGKGAEELRKKLTECVELAGTHFARS